MQKNITIINKLGRKDSVTGLDIWYKHTIESCQYKVSKKITLDGTIISKGQVFTLLVPFSSRYMPYSEWKDSLKKEQFFTLNPGDYIIVADVIEQVNPDNIQSIFQQYKPNAFQIESFYEVDKRFTSNYQFKVEGS